MGSLNDVRHNRAGCWKLSCPASIEHGGSQHISLYHDPVKHIIDRIQGIILLDHHRSNKGINLASRHTAGAKKLHRGPHLFRIFEINIRDPGNPLRINILKVHFPSSCHGCQNGNLSAGVMSFHVSLRVAFRISQVLRFLQGVLKGFTLFIHLGKNKVGGSV